MSQPSWPVWPLLHTNNSLRSELRAALEQSGLHLQDRSELKTSLVTCPKNYYRAVLYQVHFWSAEWHYTYFNSQKVTILHRRTSASWCFVIMWHQYIEEIVLFNISWAGRITGVNDPIIRSTFQMDSIGLSGLATQQIQCSLIAVVVMNRHEEFREKNRVFSSWASPSQIPVLLVATTWSHRLGSKVQKCSDVPGKCCPARGWQLLTGVEQHPS